MIDEQAYRKDLEQISSDHILSENDEDLAYETPAPEGRWAIIGWTVAGAAFLGFVWWLAAHFLGAGWAAFLSII